MKRFKGAYIPLILAIILFFVFVGMVWYSIFVNNSANNKNVSSQNNPPKLQAKPLPESSLPTLPPQQGGGIDLQASVLKQSAAEIQKITPFLPYKDDVTLSTQETVSLLIPEKDLQPNTWTLSAQIFNLNYNTSPGQPDYTLEKNSFREAANLIFAWIRQKGANPDKIIFVWGDRKYIRDQAESWLKDK